MSYLKKIKGWMKLNSQQVKNFWEVDDMSELTPQQWESLCDGCGKCCVYQVEDEDAPGSYYQTNVSCRLLDNDLGRCTSYVNRQSMVPDCMTITPENISTLDWLPETCAYRRVYFKKELPEWHHLVCGDNMAVHKAGASVSGRCIPDTEIEDIEDHIVVWKDF